MNAPEAAVHAAAQLIPLHLLHESNTGSLIQVAGEVPSRSRPP